MGTSAGLPHPSRSPTLVYLVGLGRGLAGAIIFGLPLLMTMEMWSLAATTEPLRLALLVSLNLPLLVGLSRLVGFERTTSWLDDALDALAAWAIGVAASAAGLALFGVLEAGMAPYDVVAKVALQAVPASIGALLAQSLLGQEHADLPGRSRGHGEEFFTMTVGALFLALNVAPTEEMVLIALKMTPWHSLALIALTLTMMHAFVYAVEFRGGHGPAAAPARAFLHFGVAGYALVLLISLYILWTFGRLEGMATSVALQSVVVLGLPSAVGAAAARLIL